MQDRNPGEYMCYNGTGKWLKPGSPDQVYMQWVLEVNGAYGPCESQLNRCAARSRGVSSASVTVMTCQLTARSADAGRPEVQPRREDRQVHLRHLGLGSQDARGPELDRLRQLLARVGDVRLGEISDHYHLPQPFVAGES